MTRIATIRSSSSLASTFAVTAAITGAVTAAIGALAPEARADGGVRKLTFEDAIALALAGNPEIALAKESLGTTASKQDGLKAKFFPSLHVDATGSLYRKPYELPFGTQTFTLYEQTTSFTTVTLSEPLTGLAYLAEVVGAAEHELNASHADFDRVRLDTAFKTADGYIRVLEARAQGDVAHQAVADIQGELDRAIQLRQADTYTDIDVLRFRSAKAAADQIALRADAAAQSALATLVIQLGLHDGEAIEIGDDLPATPPPLALTLEQAQQRALSGRPELKGAREKISAANDTRIAAYAGYFPDIRAVAVWDHTTGVQPFQPKDAEFLGLRLSWTVWDWGATHHQIVEAEHARSRATVIANAMVDQVRVDVRKRWLDAKTAYDSLAVAQTQQQTAEEAYRLQKVRFDNAASTTTDVLDADTDVAKARTASAVARYDYYLALVGLARAVGDVPKP